MTTIPASRECRRKRHCDPARGRDDGQRARTDGRLFERLADAHDPVDREAIVRRFLPLARHLAGRYARPGEPFEDVFQAACIGLINAVDRFDPVRGVAFSSYAVPTIVGEIKRHYRDRARLLHVPRGPQELAPRVDRARSELSMTLGREPSVDELADHVDADRDAVLEAIRARSSYRVASLDAPREERGGDREPLGNLLPSLEAGFGRAEDRVLLAGMLQCLTRREREVLYLRFHEDLTQQAIGERVGVSQMQVSRLLHEAIGHLRELARADAPSVRKVA